MCKRKRRFSGLNASFLVTPFHQQFFFLRSIHSFYLELRKRQALVPEETSSAYRYIRRPRLGAEMGSGSLPTRPSPSALSPPWPIPGRARPPRLCSLGTGVCVFLSLPCSLCFTAAVPNALTIEILVTGFHYDETTTCSTYPVATKHTHTRNLCPLGSCELHFFRILLGL